MSKLWKEIERIAKHTKNIIFNVFSRITRGTTSAFKAVGTCAAALTTFVVISLIFLTIGIIAIPFGTFGKENPAEATEIVDNSVNESIYVTSIKFPNEGDLNEVDPQENSEDNG